MNIFKAKTEKRIVGDMGERAARRFLFFRGYRILKKNYISDYGEIDIIAKRKDTVVFVEVKTRSLFSDTKTEPRPASAVNCSKQQKIIRSAMDYRYNNLFSKKMRFDIIEVLYEPSKNNKIRIKKINHLINAFDKDTAYKKHYKAKG